MQIKGEKLVSSYITGKIEYQILKDINLEINNGDFVLIMGTSGSGKTTLLNTISGLLKKKSGKLYINEQDTDNFKESDWANLRKNKFGFIFQSYQLINTLTVYENIMLAKSISKKKDSNDIKKVLEDIGISHLENKYPDELSGGEQQRACIARALINNPEIIFADEPTGALDSKNSEKILDLLKFINEKYNTTIILVSHQVENSKYANRIIKLKDGVIYED